MSPNKKLLVFQVLRGLPPDLQRKIFCMLFPSLEQVRRQMDSQLRFRPEFQAIDNYIACLIYHQDPAMVLADLRPDERRFTHLRCEALGLGHIALGGAEGSKNRDMAIKIPATWYMDVSQPPKRLDWGANTKKWTRICRCSHCNVKLQAYKALVAETSLGPFCEACIHANEDFVGLKWRPITSPDKHGCW